MPVSRNPRAVTSKIPKISCNTTNVENLKADKVSVGHYLTEENSQTKRSSTSPQGAPKKRSAFGDITNASKAQFLQVKKNAVKQPKKAQKVEAAPKPVPENKVVVQKKSLNETSSKAIPPSDPPEQKLTEAVEKLPVKEPIVKEVQCNVEQVSDPYDVDKESSGDPFMSSEYAKDIFDYLKERELKFGIESYINKQQDLNKEMRAILVDWMVEVQENFELNHETLYLSVKLVDHYLSEVICMRESLQLIGSTSMLLASKFEERCPPCVDDFLYICDDAYKREELINMEMNILRVLKFDINIPIAYRFLRRYAKCAQTSMETLTLARYICELTLQELDFVSERASQLAAACLLLAMAMKKIGGWTPTLEYHTGHTVSDLLALVKRLNFLVTYPTDEKLKAVRSKYSHRVFFEVAKIKPLDMLDLHQMLEC
uniref:Cyclin B3 n=1 Tax=Erpetoichthys calabaricus TaxID=27687 RepID=A0A8C4SCA5_ERPCA